MNNNKLFYLYDSLSLALLMLVLPLVAIASANMNELGTKVLNGGHSKAVFYANVSSTDSETSSLIYEDNQQLEIQFSITIDPIDEDLRSKRYLMVKHNQHWYYLDKQRSWQVLSEDMANLQGFETKTLQETEVIRLNSGQLFGAGEYSLYAGYLNHRAQKVLNAQALTFIIFDSNDPSLHQIHSEQVFLDYFKRAFSQRNNLGYYYSNAYNFYEPGIATTAANSTHLSTSNVPNQSNDTAGIIKTVNDYLYTLGICKDSSRSACFSIYNISESPPANTLISQHRFQTANSIGSFYLNDIQIDSKAQSLAIRVFGSSDFDWAWWSYPTNWQNGKTGINILDISNPESIHSLHGITLDGNLVTSRLVEQTLYVVTRQTPVLQGYHDWIPVEANEYYSQEIIDTNQQLLEQMSGADVIPAVNFHISPPTTLFEPKDCMLTPHSDSKNPEQNIISIVAIPLNNPADYQTQCIIGPGESIYASDKAIYLATNRYQYDLAKSEYSLDNTQQSISTDIHKFSLSDNQLSYRGSGTVLGHLGWELDNKPRRMGEYNAQLRVISSTGNSINDSSSTLLTLLHEAPDGDGLISVGGVNPVINSNNVIYISHLIAKRGYLKTGEKAGMLYVLNLEDVENPELMGQLSVDDFAQDLYPIGNTHLLGLGYSTAKQTDENYSYLGQFIPQTLKLSLFNVSDSNSIQEVQTTLIGKRPTHSYALMDQHAFTFLDGDSARPTRFVIPVNLHDSIPEYTTYDDLENPNNYYAWTHFGLYVFELDDSLSSGFQLIGKWIGGEAIPDYNFLGPRYGYSVLQGNSIHFFYNGELHSSAIADLD